MPYKNNADRRQNYSDNKEKKKKDAKNKRRRERRQNKDPEERKEDNRKRRERYHSNKKKGSEQMVNQNEETMRTPSKVDSTSTPTAFTPIQSASKLAGMTPDRLSALKESTKRRRANIEWKKAQMKSLQEQTNSALKIVAGVREDSKTALGLVKEQTANVESTFSVQEELETDEQLIIIAEAEAEAAAEAEAEAEMENEDGARNLLDDFDNTTSPGPASVKFCDNDTQFFHGESPPNSVRKKTLVKGILKEPRYKPPSPINNEQPSSPLYSVAAAVGTAAGDVFNRAIEYLSSSSDDDTNYHSPRSEGDRSEEDRSGEEYVESDEFEGYDVELAAADKIPIEGAEVDTGFENAPEARGVPEESKEEIRNEDDSKEDDSKEDTVFKNAPEVRGVPEESKEEIRNEDDSKEDDSKEDDSKEDDSKEDDSKEDDSKEDDTGIKLEKPRRRRKISFIQPRSTRRSTRRSERLKKNKGTDQD